MRYIILVLIIVLTGCFSSNRVVSDFIYKSSSRKSPVSLNPKISFTGYLYGTYGNTDITVVSDGDTIVSIRTSEPVYTLSLKPRLVQEVIFKNENRSKRMTFVNFTKVSERESFDVNFRNNQSVLFVKTRPTDRFWRVIFYRHNKIKPTF